MVHVLEEDRKIKADVSRETPHGVDEITATKCCVSPQKKGGERRETAN